MNHGDGLIARSRIYLEGAVGSFSIWHWIILVLVIGAGYFLWRTSRNPTGFGGWLLLVVVGQTVAPLSTINTLVNPDEGYGPVMQLPNGPIVVVVEVAMLLALAVFQAGVAVAMHKRKRSFPFLFLYQWFAVGAIAVINPLFISAVLGVGLSQLFTPEDITRIGAMLLAMGVWVLYIFRSERVKSTFVL